MRPDVAASKQQKAAKAVTVAKLKAVDSTLWGQKTSRTSSKQPLYSVMASLSVLLANPLTSIAWLVLASLHGMTHAVYESIHKYGMA